MARKLGELVKFGVREARAGKNYKKGRESDATEGPRGALTWAVVGRGEQDGRGAGLAKWLHV